MTTTYQKNNTTAQQHPGNKPYSRYEAIITSGEDAGGAANLCAAAEEKFPGIDAHLDGNPNQPSGLVIAVDGGNATTCKEIKEWLEYHRENYC